MDRNSDVVDVPATYELSATNFTPMIERSYAPAHEAATTAATNEDLNGREQENPQLTPVDALLKIDHWKPAEPQFCKEIAAHYGQSKRTIQKWFVDLREIAPWFSEVELRLSDDRYSPLAVELLGQRYFSGSKKKWATILADQFADQGKALARDRAAASPYHATPCPSAVTPEVMPSESSADEEFDEFYVPSPNLTIVPTRKIRMPSTADDFDFGSALARLGGNQGLAVSDSKRLVDAAEKLLNGMATALEQKVDQQAESLHSDLEQLQRLEETKLDFLRRTSFAARQAKDLASRQTEVTEELTTTYHEIASLGKPLADRRASGQ